MASAELAQAFEWYTARSPEVAERFLDELDATMVRIAENPEAWPAVRGARRRRYLPGMTVPPRIETPRLVLRRYRPEDAPLLKEAIDQSLDRLQPWMPWARSEPTPLPQLTERLATFAADYDAGTEWVIGIFDREERRLLGGTGLHRRGPGHVLEIGYWIRTGAEGQGYITEAVDALRRVASLVPGVTHVRICCDPRNLRSAAVPGRLGFVSLGLAAAVPGDDRAETATWESVVVPGNGAS